MSHEWATSAKSISCSWSQESCDTSQRILRENVVGKSKDWTWLVKNMA
jgi:hypothetical protein